MRSPNSYTDSFNDLRRDKRTAWGGVRNPVALKNMRRMKNGDRVMIYHAGTEKAVVGLAKVVKPAYPDPDADDEKLVAVDIQAEKPLPSAVTLEDVKADDTFEDFALVRQPRLSVIPVPKTAWARLLRMSAGG